MIQARNTGLGSSRVRAAAGLRSLLHESLRGRLGRGSRSESVRGRRLRGARSSRSASYGDAGEQRRRRPQPLATPPTARLTDRVTTSGS